MIDLNKVNLTFHAFEEQNTHESFTHLDDRTLQVGVLHRFDLDFQDIFENKIPPNVFLDPPYEANLRRDGTVLATNSSYMDVSAQQNTFNIFVRTAIKDGGQLFVQLNGVDINNSPFSGFRVLPGKLHFSHSPIVENNLKTSYVDNVNEWKRPRCYVGEVCTLQVTLYDEYGNVLDQAGDLLRYTDMHILRLGPYDNIDGVSPVQEYFQNLTQYFPASPQLYYINYVLENVGTYRIYARSRKDGFQQASVYPVEVATFSDIPSASRSEVVPDFRYVGQGFVTVTAKDKFGNTLTDHGVRVRASLEFDDTATGSTETYWDARADYAMIAHSQYLMTLYPRQRGFYRAKVYICVVPENTCDWENISEFTLHAGSPFQVYLTSKFPNPAQSFASGEALSFAAVQKDEFFFVQLKDYGGNDFDVLNDEIHLKVNLDQYIAVTMEHTATIWPSGDVIQAETQVVLDNYDLEQGLFRYKFNMAWSYDSTLLHVKVLDTEPTYVAGKQQGLSEEELKQLDYVSLSSYVHVRDSPIEVRTAGQDSSAMESYIADLLYAGLAMYQQSTVKEALVSPVPAGTPFVVPLNLTNIYDAATIPATYDSQIGDIKEYILLDFTDTSLQCVKGTSQSRLRRYCGFFSYSRAACTAYKHCAWVPNELAPATTLFENQDISSCQPCSAVQDTQDGADPVTSYELALNGDRYEATAAISVPGTYDVDFALMEIGSLRVLLYDHIDYTFQFDDARLARATSGKGGGFNFTFDDFFSALLHNRTTQYSAVIQGALRFDNSSFYNLTFATNLIMKVYIDKELVVSKTTLQDEHVQLVDFWFKKDSLYDVEVFLRSDGLYQETRVFNEQNITTRKTQKDTRQEQVFGYLEVLESSPFLESRIIKPKNMFRITSAANSGDVKVVVT